MNIPLPVVFILAAAALYTLVIFREKFLGFLKPWMMFVFFLAFLFDLLGTTQMFAIAENIRRDGFLTIHSLMGYASLLIMFVHFLVAVLAIQFGEWQYRFGKYSLWAWAFWMATFITGGCSIMFD